MTILQGGAPKCGNFWLYQILQQVQKFSGQDPQSFIQKQPIYELAKEWELNYPSQASIDVLTITDLQCSYRISSIYRMPIDSLEDYVSQTNHVWTHSPICKRSREVFGLFEKKAYIIRDPRDRAISASNYYCSDYMLKYFPQEERDPKKFLDKNFEKLMKEWVWHVFDHLRLSKEHNIHPVFFENLLNDFQKELSQLLTYLEVKLDEEERLQLENSVSFTALQPENPKHLRKGRSGYWKEKLSEEQKEIAEMMAGPLLDLLGYADPEREQYSLPTGTEVNYDELKEEIILSQRPLFT